MKVAATQSPGGGGLRQRVQKGVDMAGWRNSRKTSVSESEQGDGRELVSEQWTMGGCGTLIVSWKARI